MKKASKKDSSAPAVAPVSLGTKRTCPKCATRFYDFAKPEIVCPKCEKKLDPEDLNPLAKIPVSTKKAAPARAVEEEEEGATSAVAGGDAEIESVDDLGDDEDEEIVEDLVEDEEEQEY